MSLVVAECCIIISQFIRLLNRQMPFSNKFLWLRHRLALLLRKPERFSLYFNGMLKVLPVCLRTHGGCCFLSPISFPTSADLSGILPHMLWTGPPSSTALLVPSCLPPASTSPTLPSAVFSCLKRHTSWLHVKSRREREIEGNCGNKALQKSFDQSGVSCWKAPWLRLAVVLRQGLLQRRRERMKAAQP